MRKRCVKLCSKSRECWEILVNGATEAADQKIEYGQMGRKEEAGLVSCIECS